MLIGPVSEVFRRNGIAAQSSDGASCFSNPSPSPSPSPSPNPDPLQVLLAVVVSCAVSGMFSLSIYDQILVLKDFPYMPHLRTERLHAQKAEVS